MAYNHGGGWGGLADFQNGSQVPDGEYVAVARSQAAFMPAGDRSGWQQATSPPLKIRWTGGRDGQRDRADVRVDLLFINYPCGSTHVDVITRSDTVLLVNVTIEGISARFKSRTWSPM